MLPCAFTVSSFLVHLKPDSTVPSPNIRPICVGDNYQGAKRKYVASLWLFPKWRLILNLFEVRFFVFEDWFDFEFKFRFDLFEFEGKKIEDPKIHTKIWSGFYHFIRSIIEQAIVISSKRKPKSTEIRYASVGLTHYSKRVPLSYVLGFCQWQKNKKIKIKN